MSRYTWVFLLHTKQYTKVVKKEFVCMVKNHFGLKIKCVRTDNGTKYFNPHIIDLFNKYGIIHQSSCVYTSQQNEVAERKHRFILDMEA